MALAEVWTGSGSTHEFRAAMGDERDDSFDEEEKEESEAEESFREWKVDVVFVQQQLLHHLFHFRYHVHNGGPEEHTRAETVDDSQI